MPAVDDCPADLDAATAAETIRRLTARCHALEDLLRHAHRRSASMPPLARHRPVTEPPVLSTVVDPAARARPTDPREATDGSIGAAIAAEAATSGEPVASSGRTRWWPLRRERQTAPA